MGATAGLSSGATDRAIGGLVMDFYEVLDQVVALLRARERVTYRALKLQFHLDDEQLETLKEELIDAKRVAVDEDSKVLVWLGEGAKEETANRRSSKQQTSNL